MRLAFVSFLFLMPITAALADDSLTTPGGEGPPNLVVCRAPQQVAGSRLMGPRVCRNNAEWAQYRKDGMDIAPDGIHDVATEKFRSSHPVNCRPTSPGGGSIATMAAIAVSTVCE